MEEEILEETYRNSPLRFCSTRPSSLNLAILVHQPLLKVPLNSLHAQKSRLLLFQPLEQRIRFIAVHIGLAHDGERDAVVELAEGLDFFI